MRIAAQSCAGSPAIVQTRPGTLMWALARPPNVRS